MKQLIPTYLVSASVRGFAVCALLCAAAPAFGTVLGSYVVNADKTVTYSYEIDNSAGSFDIFSWSLDLGIVPDWDPLDAPAGDVTVPNADWIAEPGIPTSGVSAQDFLSFGAGDVLIGSSLSGFSFTSAFLPGPIAYFEFSPTGDFASGQTIGPAFALTNVPDSGGRTVEAMALLSVAALGAARQANRRASYLARNQTV